MVFSVCDVIHFTSLAIFYSIKDAKLLKNPRKTRLSLDSPNYVIVSIFNEAVNMVLLQIFQSIAIFSHYGIAVDMCRLMFSHIR